MRLTHVVLAFVASVGTVPCAWSQDPAPVAPPPTPTTTDTPVATPPEPAPQAPPTFDPRARRKANRERLKEAEADISAHAAKFAPHVVRVQTWNEFVSKRVDGVEYDRRRINGPLGHGIILRSDPLILVSGSISEVDLPKLPDPVAPSRFTEISPERYEILTSDNRPVQAEVIARDDALNLLLLRPSNPDEVPATWKIDLEIPASGRPLESTYVGITMFSDSQRDGSVAAFVVHIPDGKNAYRRPALPGIGRIQLGLPIFDREGSLNAIVGIAPNSEPAPAWVTDPARRLERPDDRDPLEFEYGRRKAVLLTVDELRPTFDRWFATNFGEVVFELFGFSIRDSDHGVHVTRVEREGAAAAAGLRAGDVVTSLDGIDVGTADAFSAALERTLGADTRTLRLAVRRGTDPVDVEMSVP